MEAFLAHYRTWKSSSTWTPARAIAEQYLRDNSDLFGQLYIPQLEAAKEGVPGAQAKVKEIGLDWLHFLEV